MGWYGLREEDEDDSFDTAYQRSVESRKRTYPNAFPEGTKNMNSDNNAIPVAVAVSGGLLLPLEAPSSPIMDCFRTVLSWIRQAAELGGRVLIVAGSWMARSREIYGHEALPPPKRQRVSSRESEPPERQQDFSETIPPLTSQSPPARPKTKSYSTAPSPVKLQHPSADGFHDSFLSGAPYVEQRDAFLSFVPRSRRHPPMSRAQKYQNLTSSLLSQSQSQSSLAGGAIRKPQFARPGPYSRVIKSQREAESRLQTLEARVRNQQSQALATPQIPTYKWGDEEVNAEFRQFRHVRKQHRKEPVSSPQFAPPPTKDHPEFKFEFSTPLPTTFTFGGQFTSPPQSGAPEHVRREGKASEIEKAQFKFKLPPSAKKEGLLYHEHPSKVQPDVQLVQKVEGLPRETDHAHTLVPMKEKHVQDFGTQPRPIPSRGRRDPEQPDENTFTILANQDTKAQHKSFTQGYTYHIDTYAPIKFPSNSRSFPPPITMKDPNVIPTPSATPSPHRRTKSAITPTRSSRRTKFTPTYAEDSHRQFIRELREILGQKKLKKDQEEKEIEDQIKKLREEGKAVESTLAGEIPRLPELLARKVHEALYDTPDDAVVVETQFGKLFGRDIHRLQKGEWLNDELINYYFLMVHERSLNPTKLRKSDSKPLRTKLPKTFAFNTFFYSLLCSRGYAGVKRWTKKRRVNLFECERILVPINKGGYHWILAMVNVTERRIEYYDSMGREGVSSENQGVLTNVRNFLVEEAKTQNISPEAVAQWTFYVPKTPKQKNGWDCGVFTCITAERLTSEVGRMTYGQDHMDRLREYMVAEIIDGVFYH